MTKQVNKYLFTIQICQLFIIIIIYVLKFKTLIRVMDVNKKKYIELTFWVGINRGHLISRKQCFGAYISNNVFYI